MSERVFGEIEGVKEGDEFRDRRELHERGVHKPTQAGISGSEKEGADSIVISGGYEDDEDYGDIIIYTGHGGRDENTEKQNKDQELERGNLALVKTFQYELPVRVIRAKEDGSGYVYSGLYEVIDYWSQIGRSGYKIWRYKLQKLPSNITYLDKKQDEKAKDLETLPNRIEVLIKKIIRDSSIVREIKELYKFKCQICGTILKLKEEGIYYAEGVHIKPLGNPHNGPDKIKNMLCLCPNHHILFDNGAISINDDFSLNGLEGILYVSPRHNIDKQYTKYHRENIAGKN
ncbi:MAG: YDG/SRA domain-containing protein [Promethearchaeota archaeon]